MLLISAFVDFHDPHAFRGSWGFGEPHPIALLIIRLFGLGIGDLS